MQMLLCLQNECVAIKGKRETEVSTLF